MKNIVIVFWAITLSFLSAYAGEGNSQQKKDTVPTVAQAIAQIDAEIETWDIPPRQGENDEELKPLSSESLQPLVNLLNYQPTKKEQAAAIAQFDAQLAALPKHPRLIAKEERERQEREAQGQNTVGSTDAPQDERQNCVAATQVTMVAMQQTGLWDNKQNKEGCCCVIL